MIQGDTLQYLDHVDIHSAGNSELSFSTIGRRLLLCQHKCSGCIIAAIGFGGYLGSIVQLGLDQLHDASSTEIKSFTI